ncbi:MAG: mutM [Gammaproteobacteria bacterium]|jgi:formamidopyrimidine-DNA glycosylase|nr:mutM [Gammaproteobacteria bacterium]
MPELPEVETTLRGILPSIKQQTIAHVVVRDYRLRWPVPANIHLILRNATIDDLWRRGKYVLFKTASGTIIIHLGMSGRLRILTEPSKANKHDHIDIVFHNEKILRFTDPRRFGAFLWVEGDPHQHALLKHLGIEPLTKNFSGKYLLERARNKKMPVKTFIMDHKVVTGIGNIYAVEALFAASVYPMQPANSLSLTQWNNLAKVIKKILRSAIQRGGTTLKDFLNSDGKPGYFSNQLKVYGRANLPCVKCGSLLKSVKLGQRSTVYCAKCQK